MTDLSATIEEVASSATEVANRSQQAAAAGEDGSEAATATVVEMNAIEETAAETAEQMERLDEEMADIEGSRRLHRPDRRPDEHARAQRLHQGRPRGRGRRGFAVVADGSSPWPRRPPRPPTGSRR